MVLNQCSDEHHYACILGTIFPWGMFLEVEELGHGEKLSLKLNEVCVCVLDSEFFYWNLCSGDEYKQQSFTEKLLTCLYWMGT